ncbi:MAG: exopolysaccharide biosynthesis protein [Acetobacteraceae bacterium]|nr:exopolysaccharide biosynthesis protein [Acetobacteraceae bacterium]
MAISAGAAGGRLHGKARRARPRAGPTELTRLVEAILRRGDGEMIPVRELLGGLDAAAFGVPLAALAMPEIIPVPIPGLTFVVALPTALIGAQMVTARERIWLPKALLDRKIPAKPLKRVARAMLPTLRKLDGWTRPRGEWMQSKAAKRLIGVAIILLALLIALPIPGTNAPLALTVFVLAMGLIRRDGLLIAAGLLLTLASFALMGGVTLVLFEALFGAIAA